MMHQPPQAVVRYDDGPVRLPSVAGIIRMKSDPDFGAPPPPPVIAPPPVQIQPPPPPVANECTKCGRQTTRLSRRYKICSGCCRERNLVERNHENTSSPYTTRFPATRRTTSEWRSSAMAANLAIHEDQQELLGLVNLANCPLCGTEIESDMPACHRHLTIVLLRAMN